jgi:hypothetical protein
MKKHASMLTLAAMAMAVAGGGCGDSDPGQADAGDGSDAKPTPDAAVCQQLATEARVQFESYLQSTSSRACAVDSDCSILHLASVRCFAGCGVSVSTTAADGVTVASTGACDPYHAAGCREDILLCLAVRPVCEHGMCTSGPPSPPDAATDALASAPEAPVCDQLAATARAQAVSYLQSNYTLACQVDTDCAFVQERGLGCVAVCGNMLIRTADAPAFTTAIAGVCDQYLGAGCPEIFPPCPYSRPICDHGTCARSTLPGGQSGTPDAAVDASAEDIALDRGSG